MAEHWFIELNEKQTKYRSLNPRRPVVTNARNGLEVSGFRILHSLITYALVWLKRTADNCGTHATAHTAQINIHSLTHTERDCCIPEIPEIKPNILFSGCVVIVINMSTKRDYQHNRNHYSIFAVESVSVCVWMHEINHIYSLAFSRPQHVTDIRHHLFKE